MHAMLEERYKIAASKKRSKKLQKLEERMKSYRKGIATPKGLKAPKNKTAHINNRQIRKLFIGLSKLISK